MNDGNLLSFRLYPVFWARHSLGIYSVLCLVYGYIVKFATNMLSIFGQYSYLTNSVQMAIVETVLLSRSDAQQNIFFEAKTPFPSAGEQKLDKSACLFVSRGERRFSFA